MCCGARTLTDSLFANQIPLFFICPVSSCRKLYWSTSASNYFTTYGTSCPTTPPACCRTHDPAPVQRKNLENLARTLELPLLVRSAGTRGKAERSHTTLASHQLPKILARQKTLCTPHFCSFLVVFTEGLREREIFGLIQKGESLEVLALLPNTTQTR